jgi:hypothetical protein
MIERLPTASNNETTQAAKDLMQESLIRCIEGEPDDWMKDIGPPPAVAMPWIDDLLSKADTYRAGALTIFCYAVASGGSMDLRPFSDGVRGTGELTKRLLPHLSIPATRGNPFETIAKGSPSYVGRARASWNDLLNWASTEATFDEVQAVTAHLIRELVALRRHVSPLPELDTERLTWAAVTDLLGSLLERPSRGAYEQLIVAALVEALHAEDVEQRRVYVTTKHVTAADESARTAGDVQVREPSGSVRDAIEVADTDWAGKIPQAVASMRRDDLRRFLVLATMAAPVSGNEVDTAVRNLRELPERRDVAVLDLHSEIRSMTARLDRVGRRRMLISLYGYLLDFQSDDELVEAYVAEVTDRGLSSVPGP